MWYIENADRWRLEQEKLTAYKIGFEIEEKSAAEGFICLYLKITEDTDIPAIPEGFLPLNLIVVFPSLYPFFRPEVYALDISLPRHQNIFDKNLCLLPRMSINWMPETLLADYLKDQLPKVLEEGTITDSNILKEKEDEQAEPVSEYYHSIPNAPIIFDTTTFDSIHEIDQDIQHLGDISLGFPTHIEFPTRIIVLESFDFNKQSLGKLPESVKNLFPYRVMGSVYRIKKRPPTGIAENDYVWLDRLLNNQNKKLLKFKHSIVLKNNNTINNVVGITFPEEHSPGEYSWGWLFFVVATLKIERFVKGRKSLLPQKIVYYAKVNRINMSELSFRIPALKPLSNKKVVILGLGALGAPSAIEFAKNGVGEITLVDFDIVNAGTIVRWPLGLKYAGLYKTDALEEFISQNYPYIKVNKVLYRVGASEGGIYPFNKSLLSDNIPIQAILSGADLIYDATAETGVSHFLSEEAKKYRIPFMSIYGTPGVWGGTVMRYIPEITKGCWMCFQYALEDGTIPKPPTNREGNIQAVGCGDISFSGASFELDNLVSSGVRLAVSTMCLSENAYPDIQGDIGILSLIDDNANPIFPKWSTHELRKHPHCPYCNK